MKLLDHFDHESKKQDKEHFKHLIQIALADGQIDESESKLLRRIGKNMGFTEPEIDDLLDLTRMSAYVPPYELEKRFEQIYSIIKMVLVDGNIDNNEMRMATSLAIKSGFVENEIPSLLALLISGIKNGEDFDDLFKRYRKQKQF